MNHLQASDGVVVNNTIDAALPKKAKQKSSGTPEAELLYLCGVVPKCASYSVIRTGSKYLVRL